MRNQTSRNNTFFIVYVIGALLGLTLTVLATWADVEAAFYGFDRTGGDQMNTLSCPILMTSRETSAFSIKVSNRTDRNLSPSIKTDISTRAAPISSYEPIKLAPGETKKMEWSIGPENQDLGRFIFARAWVYAAYPQPDLENTCGIFILPLPGKGTFYTWAMILLSLAGMGYGLYGFKKASPNIALPAFLTVVVVAGLLIDFQGIWLAGVLILAVSLLVIVIALGQAVRS
ncbi:MAG TPA: hypothetical protein PKI78_05440 [Anaerolineales bacterium]|nr:hypothetical protein [Anaerolineales bacterium]